MVFIFLELQFKFLLSSETQVCYKSDRVRCYKSDTQVRYKDFGTQLKASFKTRTDLR